MKNLKIEVFVVLVTLLLAASLLNFCAESLFAAQSVPRYGGTLRVGEQMDGVSIGYPPKLVRLYS